MYFDFKTEDGRIEFHTGNNWPRVASGGSLNSAISLTGMGADPWYISKWLSRCLYEARVHDMEFVGVVESERT